MSAAVVIEGVSKKFILHHDRPRSFQAMLLSAAKGEKQPTSEEFWALRDISLNVECGETLGLIGENGSGKSTLLKLIARIVAPTTGSIWSQGRLSALLELGAGFHPDLTGRENIFLHGSILGLGRRQVVQRFDDIVKFAELQRFIDVPLKHYSSGMQMRLGFAIATHVDPDILLVDEVLAVGDEAFQDRCLEQIRQFQRQGKTIIFVSHDLDAVKRICNRVALLEDGRIKEQGPPSAVVDLYHVMLWRMADKIKATETGSLPVSACGQTEYERAMAAIRAGRSPHVCVRGAQISEVKLLDQSGSPVDVVYAGQETVLELAIEFSEPVDNPVLGFVVRRAMGDEPIIIYDTNTLWRGIQTGSFLPGQAIKVQYRQKMDLGNGDYSISTAIASHDTRIFYDWKEAVLRFRVQGADNMQGIADLQSSVWLNGRRLG